MSALVRLQFAKRPSDETLARILAVCAFDTDFEDSDVLEDES